MDHITEHWKYKMFTFLKWVKGIIATIIIIPVSVFLWALGHEGVWFSYVLFAVALGLYSLYIYDLVTLTEEKNAIRHQRAREYEQEYYEKHGITLQQARARRTARGAAAFAIGYKAGKKFDV
jgi:hypothetical protein